MENRHRMCENLKQLTPVDINDVWETEPHHFTPWLAKEENLTLLGNALGMELELEAQEINVGDFRADILCKNTEDDSWVIIENQLDPTDHKHAGQLLTYAAGLEACTVIWIAKTFRSEHSAMLDWQNRITDDRYRFFGVEMKVWQIGASDRAVQFDIISSPNNWVSGVNRETRNAANRELPETRQQFRRYWTGLRDYIDDNDKPVSLGTPGTRAFHQFGIGKVGFKLMAWLLRAKGQIGIRFVMGGDNAEAHFRLLEEQKEEIHNDFGETLEWNELQGSQSFRISLYKEDTPPLDENNWIHQYKWFTAKLERFNQVFRPRIRVLNAADWVSESENDDE